MIVLQSFSQSACATCWYVINSYSVGFVCFMFDARSLSLFSLWQKWWLFYSIRDLCEMRTFFCSFSDINLRAFSTFNGRSHPILPTFGMYARASSIEMEFQVCYVWISLLWNRSTGISLLEHKILYTISKSKICTYTYTQQKK